MRSYPRDLLCTGMRYSELYNLVCRVKEVIETSFFMFPLYIGMTDNNIKLGVQHVLGTVLCV